MYLKLQLIPAPWVLRVAATISMGLLVIPDATARAADSAGDAHAAEVGFEDPPILQAPDLLPEYLLSGDVFVVEAEVRNDGETNLYVVRSPTGHIDARGRDALERTIQELRAHALLSETPKRTGAVVGFNQGMKDVATAPYDKVKRVVFNPLYAIEVVPGEIVDYAGKVATVSDLFKYGPGSSSAAAWASMVPARVSRAAWAWTRTPKMMPFARRLTVSAGVYGWGPCRRRWARAISTWSMT